jgi:lipopolysaccharide biosynthesis regulator YciM
LLAAIEGDGQRVEQVLAQIVRANSNDIDAYLALARLYRERSEVGRAISIHQTLVLRSDLESEQRIFALGELAADFHAGGFHRRAIASYEEVLEHDRRSSRALGALVELLTETGEHARALVMLRRRARVEGRRDDRGEAALLVAMGVAKKNEGRSDMARKAAKRALRRDRECAAAYLLLGDLEAERGRNAKALVAWSKLAELDDAPAEEVYPRLEGAFASLGRSAEFEALLRARLAAIPSDCAARMALARHLAERGDADDGIAELRRVLDFEPSHAGAHLALGKLLLSLHREVDALKEYASLLTRLESLGIDAGPQAHAGPQAEESGS